MSSEQERQSEPFAGLDHKLACECSDCLALSTDQITRLNMKQFWKEPYAQAVVAQFMWLTRRHARAAQEERPPHNEGEDRPDVCPECEGAVRMMVYQGWKDQTYMRNYFVCRHPWHDEIADPRTVGAEEFLRAEFKKQFPTSDKVGFYLQNTKAWQEFAERYAAHVTAAQDRELAELRQRLADRESGEDSLQNAKQDLKGENEG